MEAEITEVRHLSTGIAKVFVTVPGDIFNLGVRREAAKEAAVAHLGEGSTVVNLIDRGLERFDVRVQPGGST